jgi:geranylgeranyl diphosphate synthase type II
MPDFNKSSSQRYNHYKSLIEQRLASVTDKKLPRGIYEPAEYILAGGGKRIRPLLLILCCEAVGGKSEDALNAAAAIEILHNFTLVHDDIMDNADTRRGRETVHKKWDRDTAILSGDGLIGFAYKFLLLTKSPRIHDIAKSFTTAIIEVCEGQSYDKEFELRKEVSIDEYIMMINKKTSELLKCCAEIGALIGGGTPGEITALKDYALNIGLAFQIQDDMLDITADEKTFGKKTGGDLREGKKTYLLLKALEVVKDPVSRQKLLSVIDNKGVKNENDIPEIKKIYETNGILESCSKAVEDYTTEANSKLDIIKESHAKDMLCWFSGMLLNRTS